MVLEEDCRWHTTDINSQTASHIPSFCLQNKMAAKKGGWEGRRWTFPLTLIFRHINVKLPDYKSKLIFHLGALISLGSNVCKAFLNIRQYLNDMHILAIQLFWSNRNIFWNLSHIGVYVSLWPLILFFLMPFSSSVPFFSLKHIEELECWQKAEFHFFWLCWVITAQKLQT